jgi:hypothetical protein
MTCNKTLQYNIIVISLMYEVLVNDLYGSMAEEARISHNLITVVPATNQFLIDFYLSDALRFPVART